MKTKELRAFLLELSRQHMDSGDVAVSKDLHKLSELFDDRSDQPVKAVLDKIRRARGI